MFAQGTVGIAPFSVQYCFPKSKQRRTLRGWVHVYICHTINFHFNVFINNFFLRRHFLSFIKFFSVLFYFDFLSILYFLRQTRPVAPQKRFDFSKQPSLPFAMKISYSLSLDHGECQLFFIFHFRFSQNWIHFSVHLWIKLVISRKRKLKCVSRKRKLLPTISDTFSSTQGKNKNQLWFKTAVIWNEIIKARRCVDVL